MFKKKFFFFIFLVSLFFLIPFNVKAQQPTEKSVVLVNPIRGNDFWEHDFNLLETPKNQYQLLSKNNLPATWLVRFDALKDLKVVEFLKSLNSQQEIGIFMEITPSLTTAARVKYNQSPNWHYAKSILLTGYEPGDRRKMIDTSFEEYKKIFNRYPRSVGAWWIDAESLNYMRDKYKIEANLDVADQFSTDQYQVWGQYWSTPFYPSKTNALMPAQSPDRKIGVVTVQWATRDPYNGYGNGVFESTYSVQANDYILHDLGIDYFEKLLNVYPQTTVGIENDFSWREFGNEYTKQLELIAKKRSAGGLKVYNMETFAGDYKTRYPQISPNVLIVADDPLGTGGKVVWYNTPKYRVGWFYNPDRGSLIRDLRLLNDSVEENCLKKACDQLLLAFGSTAAIDDVNFNVNWLFDEGKISDFKVTQSKDAAKVVYKNQSGVLREIEFLPNDIRADDKVQTISFAILDAVTKHQQQSVQEERNFTGTIDWSKNLPRLILGSFKFALLTIFFFLLPGYVISRRWLIAIPVGWVTFTLFAYIIGYLKAELLIWIFPVLGVVLFKYRPIKPKLPRFGRELLLAIGVIFLGSSSWLITVVKSGLIYTYGLGFWGPNGHDGIWHLSLISSLQKNIPPENPIFAGEVLTNYHYFFNLLLAKSGQLLYIDSVDLLFRFYPFMFAVFCGILTFIAARNIYLKFDQDFKIAFVSGLSAMFFMYFGGSFGWIVSYFRDKSFGGESMFWSQQAISTLLNPPFAISLVLLLTGMVIFIELPTKTFKKSFSKDFLYKIFPLILVWGSVIEFKAYAGVLILLSLGIVALERLIKKDFAYFSIALFSGVLASLVFLPANIESSALFIWSPFWIITTMVQFQDRLGWQRLDLAMQSGVLYKIVLSYVLATVIFFVGNLGTRIIFVFSLLKLVSIRILLYIVILGSIFTLFFIQKGTNWNTIQFFYYVLFVLNIFAGISLALVFKKFGFKVGSVIFIVLILFTIPTSLSNLNQYIPDRPPAMLSLDEYEALNILRKLPDGNVLTLPYDSKSKDKYASPIPLYAYESTAYVAAFSGKSSFLEDTVNLEILGIDYKGRLNLQRDFIRSVDIAKKLLEKENIRYVYINKARNISFDGEKSGLTKIFENDGAVLYKRN